MALNLDSSYGVGSKKSAALSVVGVDDGRFDYHQRIQVEVSQKDSRDFWIRPIGGVVNQQGPFLFSIDPTTDRYLQLNNARLEMRLRVTKSDGTPLLPHRDVVAPINLLGACLFESVDVTLNGQPLNAAGSGGAGYKAFLETLLSYDTDAANTHLNSCFLHMDSPGEVFAMDVKESKLKQGFVDSYKDGILARPGIPPEWRVAAAAPGEPEPPDDAELLLTPLLELVYQRKRLPKKPEEAANEEELALIKQIERGFLYHADYKRHLNLYREGNLRLKVRPDRERCNVGFNDRYRIVSGSDIFDVSAPITHDIFKMDNHLAPGNRLDIKLSRYPDRFLLNSYQVNQNYKLEILDMKLHLRSIERTERIVPPDTEVYQMNECQLHRQVIPANSASASFRVHSAGNMPKTIIVGMVSTKGADGAYDYNPFYFHHHHCTKMNLVINGRQHPVDGLRTDFDNKGNSLYSHAYHWLFANSGAADGSKGNLVAWDGFGGGQFIQVFDLTPDWCNSAHQHRAEPGFIDLELTFSRPLREAVYVLYELVYPKALINDKPTGQVITLDVTA